MTAPPPAPQLLRARWYDGRSSQPRAVHVALVPARGGPALVLHASGAAPLRLEGRQIGWPEMWSARTAPQQGAVVDLGEAGSLEIDDAAAWHAARRAAGGRASVRERLQTRWPALLVGLLLAAVIVTLFYRHATPWLAAQLTRHVPLPWEQALSRHALREMDDGVLEPSRLAPERQAALRARFEALVAHMPALPARYAHYAPRYTLDFRRGLGANAFALPGGAIVVTDGLVEAARAAGLQDDAIAGVLAHEIGHVAHRHTTRMLVEQGVVQMGLGLALGDVSGLLATGSSALTGLAYQRSHEREADCHALALLRQAGLPSAPMADLLLHIGGDSKAKREARPSEGEGTADAGAGWTDWLGSHPATAERARQLRAGQAPHCS
ncbi:M48 family metallopeptidase [Pulveribacter sp.]|uniref:M48 family metallopeptidase n=1 Tax=Pulveribacter sp. TaxID=2678893 RepID=UPI0028A63034|nr:M48 family metallopeptidase [Pulveribacter sp.]